MTQIPATKRITSTYYIAFYLENIAFGEACSFLSLTAICNIERLYQISFKLFANFIFYPLFIIFPLPVIPGLIFFPGCWLFFFLFSGLSHIKFLRQTYIYVASCGGIEDNLVFWIPRRGFWILNTGFQTFSVDLDSRFQL